MTTEIRGKLIELADEEWRAIPGFANYEISSRGAIRRESTQRIIKSVAVRNGYRVVTLCGGTCKTKMQSKVHRLVLAAFAGPAPTKFHQGNHKNGNTGDNRIENLEWATPSENIVHAFRIGLIDQRGFSNNAAGLNEADAVSIKAYRNLGETMIAIGRRFGVSHATISRFLGGKTYAQKEQS